MLDAARRIGQGDFSHKVPVVGKDEMAGLASEFNKMSDRLKTQMDELRRQQIEIDRSVSRIGEAFASGLDRQALLQVVVETSLAACRAEYGTIVLSGRDGSRGRGRRAQSRASRRGSGRSRQGERQGRPGRSRGRRLLRAGGTAATARGASGHHGGDDGRTPRRAVQPRRARRLPVSGGPGLVLDREHRAARAGLRAGRHRRAHRASPTIAASGS